MSTTHSSSGTGFLILFVIGSPLAPITKSIDFSNSAIASSIDDVITAPLSPNVFGITEACGFVKSGYIFFMVLLIGR